MIGISYSSSIIGVDAHLVSVQTKISGLIKKFSIIGLPDSILKEAKDRVRCAIEQSGFIFPYGDIVVNLSPATIPKYGSGYDLAIALSILSANGVIDPALLSRYLALGELELDGTIKPVWGGVATASMIKDSGPFTLLANHLTARNAKYIKEVNVYAVKNLLEAVSFINGTSTLEQFSEVDSAGSQNTAEFLDSFRDVIGQSSTKRALEIVAAGGHNLLMIGPPGVGKSMLAKRVTSIMPELSLEEKIELTKIYEAQKSSSIGDNKKNDLFISARPYRSPHYSTSLAGIVGGGSIPSPGEISLSHRGILFLDEVTEMRRDVLESLRQPLETKNVTISRAKHRISYPADFTLIAAMNPCPCGKRGLSNQSCRCSPHEVLKYIAKLSGPILDRIDLQIWVPQVKIAELSQEIIIDQTAEMKERVLQARAIQFSRFGSIRINSQMSNDEIKKYCILDSKGKELLNTMAEKMNFSARLYYRILKVARTIADMENISDVNHNHIAEAINYRVAISK